MFMNLGANLVDIQGGLQMGMINQVADPNHEE